MVGGAVPVFQVYGFEWDYFTSNYLWGQTKPICGPSNIGGLRDNIFIPAIKEGAGEDANDNTAWMDQVDQDSLKWLTKWQSADDNKCDPGKVVTMTLAEVQALANGLVGLA